MPFFNKNSFTFIDQKSIALSRKEHQKFLISQKEHECQLLVKSFYDEIEQVPDDRLNLMVIWQRLGWPSMFAKYNQPNNNYVLSQDEQTLEGKLFKTLKSCFSKIQEAAQLGSAIHNKVLAYCYLSTNKSLKYIIASSVGCAIDEALIKRGLNIPTDSTIAINYLIAAYDLGDRTVAPLIAKLYEEQGELEQTIAWYKNSAFINGDYKKFIGELRYLAFKFNRHLQAEIKKTMSSFERSDEISMLSQKISFILNNSFNESYKFNVDSKDDRKIYELLKAIVRAINFLASCEKSEKLKQLAEREIACIKSMNPLFESYLGMSECEAEEYFKSNNNNEVRLEN